MKLIYFAAAVLAVAAVARADPSWNDFRGSFLIMKDEAFAPFPKTIRDEQFTTEGWVPVSSTEDDCTNGGAFNGIQHVKTTNNSKDYSVGLLYDKNGIIAGIQMLILKSLVMVEGNPVNYNIVPMYINATYEGQDYFVLTAYLVDPATICEGPGRTDDELASGGTGSGLWFQNGPTPSTIIPVPYNRPEGAVATESGWFENNCFPAMGFHNFRYLERYIPTNCSEMTPVFGLYNRQKVLHGFGFITPGTLTHPRFEHPPEAAIKLILGPDQTPQCVIDMEKAIGVSSLHVYFKQQPWFITCPVFSSIATLIRGYGASAAGWFRSLG